MTASDFHNKSLNVYKRNLNFYINIFKDFYLIDFRLFDNRNLKIYMENDLQSTIDINMNSDDYNWTFCALFKMKDMQKDMQNG